MNKLKYKRVFKELIESQNNITFNRRFNNVVIFDLDDISIIALNLDTKEVIVCEKDNKQKRLAYSKYFFCKKVSKKLYNALYDSNKEEIERVVDYNGDLIDMQSYSKINQVNNKTNQDYFTDLTMLIHNMLAGMGVSSVEIEISDGTNKISKSNNKTKLDLDTILDKINSNGIDSLTEEEKVFLNNLK